MSLKRFLFSLMFALVLLGLEPAFSQEVIEITVPEAIVQEFDESLTIKVGDKTYRVEAPSQDLQDHLKGLSEARRNEFHHNRHLFLTIVARALQVIKYGVGVGTLVKDKITYQVDAYNDLERQRIVEALATRNPYQAQRLRAMLESEQASHAEQRANKVSVPQRAEHMVSASLNALDRKLWSHADFFAHSNEFGLMLATGPALLGGAQGAQGFGGLQDIGISIGYNKDTHALAFQIFHDAEKFQSTVMPAVFMTGVVLKTGIYIANKKTGELKHAGSAFYPPMLPGFTSLTHDTLMAGFSSGLTWPPSPAGDALTYTNRVQAQTTALRITVSPMTKGFIRVETGLNHKSFVFIVDTVKHAIQMMTRGFEKIKTAMANRKNREVSKPKAPKSVATPRSCRAVLSGAAMAGSLYLTPTPR